MEHVYVQFIASFLDQRSVRVRVGVELSASFTPAAGVPQGSVLSPLLYALYCVDIPQPTEHGDGLAQYADDTVYFSSARNSYIATEQLQALVVRLEEWMHRTKEGRSMCRRSASTCASGTTPFDLHARPATSASPSAGT
ncbi:hypothetical protein CBL_12487 [Carabus blaptoides fortunei]